MSSSQVRSDIKTDLASFMTTNYPNVPVLDDPNNFRDRDTVFDADPDTWISVLFYEYETEQVSLGPQGSRTWRETGMIDITVFVPSGEGDSELLTMIEAIKSHYRGVTIGQVSCLSTNGPDVAIESDAFSSRGNWYGYSVEVEYRYDYCD